MTRVAVFGDVFARAVEVLGLERSDEPEIVLVDLSDARSTAAAARCPIAIPRIAIGGTEHEQLLRAAGCALPVAPSAEPAMIGPLVAAALPARSRSASRLVAVTGPRGGSGRTLLVAGVAERLAARAAVLVIDATGSGMAAWWLRAMASPWPELEGLVDELTTEHLATVAAEGERVRVIGGASVMPSARLLAATLREAAGLADVVLVDAPPPFDERTAEVIAVSDRVLLVAIDDAVGLAAVERIADDARTWLIASRTRAERVGERDAVRSLPEDPAAVAAAARGPARVGGALGRAYDALADLLAIDIT